jgi:hypothetical protein
MISLRVIPRFSPGLFRRYGILMLGLGMLAGSARATTTYCAACPNTQTAFNTAVTGLSSSGLMSFPTSDLQEEEYTDSSTQVEFLGFTDAQVSGHTYYTEGSPTDLTVDGTLLASSSVDYTAGEVIEIILPADVVALELNISSPSGASSYCVLPASSFQSNACNNFPMVTSSSDVEFVGLTNISPTTIWLGPANATSPTVAINSFEVFTNQSAQSAVPEGPTMLLLGSGLTALFGLHRRRRQPLPV